MQRSQLPPWVDRREYPFESRLFQTQHGALHYVDEGRGPAIVMLHGNPSWSFEYRHMVKALAAEWRCIAVDHLGFGLSDKPYDVAYTPALHAENLTALLDTLKLDSAVLFIGDWGGPIGLSYALARPEVVKGVVLANSWAWPIGALDFYYQGFSRFRGGPLGRYLIRNHNFFVEQVMTGATGRRAVLTPAVMAHYRGPFESSRDRKASWCFPLQITTAYDWLDGIWSRRDAFRHLPFLVLWGRKDIAFRMKELAVWRRALTAAEVHTFDDVGHYVAEEAPAEALSLVRPFLARTLQAARGAARGAA